MEEKKDCPILSLSTELVLQIFEYALPSVNLAFTCSTLYQHCRPLLDLHRGAHAKYKITSDLDPETVIDLLKNTSSARVGRWHVRELEIWGNRTDWQDWRPRAPEQSGLQFTQGTPTRSELDTGELQRYIQAGNEWWEFSGTEIDNITQELRSGQDAYLKLLLIALCPRLHSIRIARPYRDLGSALKKVTKAINASRSLAKWPPGFESLRNIAVNVETGFPIPKNEDADEDEILEEHQMNAVDFVALFFIPSVESIYFNDLWQDPHAEEEQGVEFEDKYDFPDNTSSVKRLFLDGISDLSAEFLCAVAGAPRSLESMVIRTPDHHIVHVDDIDTLVNESAKCQPDLKELIMYNPSGMHGYRCVVYRPEELGNFKTIKRITVAAADIELDGLYQLTIHDRQLNAEDLGGYVIGAFPSTIEALYIWGRSDVHIDNPDPEKPSDIFDSVIAHLIESGVYQNLKAIYLDDVERAHRQRDHLISQGQPFNAGRKELAFQKSVAAGNKAGVHVHTLMNRDDDDHYWRNFPARPDKFALKTGCFGERPLEWKFNLQTGEWGQDCDGCGECKECLTVYPPELWKSTMRS
ncbi:hypothetical protein FHETE_8111 [Fusarium heterosporum]|uniref:Uncharacterized protein n=1 Tax=Fusarium heterosporum TaxID=42747 RepID=A0A8H5WJG3_FUSHE|nr:hypothetical protein FHETE_8111 [Fusarium heterosporum]